jgi:hypothetical protein
MSAPPAVAQEFARLQAARIAAGLPPDPSLGSVPVRESTRRLLVGSRVVETPRPAMAAPPRFQAPGNEDDVGNQPPDPETEEECDCAGEEDCECDEESDGQEETAARALALVNAGRRARNEPLLTALPYARPRAIKPPRRFKGTSDQKATALKILNASRKAKGLALLTDLDPRY